MNRRARRSDRLLEVLSPYDSIVVVGHDTPDPDAVAAGWALCSLISHRLHDRVRLVGSGEILRAENQQMLRLLRPPLEMVERIEPNGRTAAVLVDCGTNRRLHLLAGRGIETVAVIDHHHGSDTPEARAELGFFDIRVRAAASASIAASYLREQSLTPCLRLATALVYAIRTETRGGASEHSSLDRSVLFWLTRFSNPTWLAEIESAPLKQAYFADLALALQSTTLYGDTAICLLPRAEGPETVGEVADLLIRCQGVQRVLCGVSCDGDILLSARTARGSGQDAGELVRKTVQGLGQGGGHPRRAGGKIPGDRRRPQLMEALEAEIQRRWIRVCGVEGMEPQWLVPRHQIIENL